MCLNRQQRTLPSVIKMGGIDQKLGRKCLVVAYHAPGESRPASIRIRRLIHGLRDLGWQVALLSTMDVGPDRVDVPDGIEYKLFKKPGLPLSKSQNATKSAGDSGNPLVRWAATSSHKLPIPLRAWWLVWSGQAVRWASQFNPDIIFSKSNPPESHMMAAVLARRLNVPWVAEFGDLWADNHFSVKKGIFYQLEKVMELKTMHRADTLVSVSKPLAVRLGQLHGKPTGVVTNCFPVEDSIKPIAPGGEQISVRLPLRILFTGRVYMGLNMPVMLMDAISELSHQGELGGDEVLVDFYCPNHDFLSEWLRQNYSHLNTMYKVHSPVSLNDSLRLQREADVLYASIWFGPGHEGVTTSKFFEYLATRRQVWVSLAGPGALSDICRHTGAAADLYSVEDCKQKIIELLNMAKKNIPIFYPSKRWHKVLNYSCLGQCRVLGSIMDNLINFYAHK